MQARHRLGLALEQLEANVLARMEEASRVADAIAQRNDGEAEQWQNACRMLEEQVAGLQDENSQLRSELHQLREDLQIMETRNSAIEAANADALKSLDEAIAQVERILKG